MGVKEGRETRRKGEEFLCLETVVILNVCECVRACVCLCVCECLSAADPSAACIKARDSIPSPAGFWLRHTHGRWRDGQES